MATPSAAQQARTGGAAQADCTPNDPVLEFDGGYRVGMCYRTPDGEVGQANAGIWASGQAGLLWFFDRDNAEVLVKVLDGCSHNGHRWVFVAPVTTLEFNLWVTAPNGRRWTHSNSQGATAATKSDTSAFPCANEGAAEETEAIHRARRPESAAYMSSVRFDDDSAAPGRLYRGGGGGPPAVPTGADSGCTPTTTALQFEGGYRVSMCYRTPDGVVGQAHSGVWSSGKAGLLWFFNRGNAEVLVKVLNGCSQNGHRWAYVAPVTTLEFNLWVTGPNGRRWTHSNRQGVTASTKSSNSAFRCSDEDGDDASAPDLSVLSPSVSDTSVTAGQRFTFSATVRNRGNGRCAGTTLRYYRSSNSTINSADTQVGTDAVSGLAASGTSAESVLLTAPSSAGTYYYGACVDSVSGESNTTNNCSSGVRITVGGRGSPEDHHAALTAGLPERPFAKTTVGGNEGSTRTVGTLRLGLNPKAFPVVVRESEYGTDLLVAGSGLGDGRIVAFSGQDFLGPDDRATLLGHANTDRLVANAVRWVGRQAGSAPLRVLVDNPRIADALQAQGLEATEVVGRRGQHERDWSASALDDVDVAVVLTNHWGTATLVPEFVASLRAFVERGGGLLVAGSALHWDWWIRQRFGRFTGDALVEGAGISWNLDSIESVESGTTRFDLLALVPGVLWEAYVAGEPLDASRVAMLPGLFGSALELGRIEELNSALARLVRETPGLPTSSAAPGARLTAAVAETLGPHEWPQTHPWAAVFPGLPAAGAHRVDGTVTVDASRREFPANASRRERHFPLGFYAPPSSVTTIEVSASHATGELAVSVGELYDNLGSGYAAQPEWRRAPWLRREFPIANRHTAITNAYGGSIALKVPADYSGTIPVTVRGAIPLAVYTAGLSSAAEWFAELNAGAPQAIIQKMGGIRLVISAERARGVTEPGEVATFWDGFQRHHADLAGEPVRAFESIWIFDPQVGWGYANAGRSRISYPIHGEHWALLPATAAGREYIARLPHIGPQPHTVPPRTGYSPAAHGVDWWLFGHELGHQWQSEDWTGHGITEVGVNLFTMYTLNYYVFGGDDFNVYAESKTHGCAAPVDHAALASRRWPTSDDCEKLALYRQLISEFGWDPMKAVFHSYYDLAYARSTYGGSLDGFAIRFSAIVERDLVGFFRHWQYPLSEAAASTIRSFGFKEWFPPGW